LPFSSDCSKSKSVAVGERRLPLREALSTTPEWRSGSVPV